jgi:G:T-mismatch repair DNA endonuclease (very short patch repair protein)
MSEAKLDQYRRGVVRIRWYRLSIEKEVAALISSLGYSVKTQFHIPGVSYFYDIYIPAMNLIIEYQGDYWHANPRKYAAETKLKIRGTTAMVDDIWSRDAQKRKAAEDRGYAFACIWEMDYKRDGAKVIQCLLSV